jgi:2-phosphoglycerate kinase
MAVRKKDRGSKRTSPEGARILVVSGEHRRPFMRGIMVHSLMARGVSFEDALATAEHVRERIKNRSEVDRAELAEMAEELVGEAFQHQPPIPVPPILHVVDDDREVPFSKGTLAQSLLASSIEPNDAWDVAARIELNLRQEGLTHVTRKALREAAHDALLEVFGQKTAGRYLVWRDYQEPEKPVIVLLGGTTGVGKTTIALEVARRLGISRVLSTDSIRQVMRIMLSSDLMPAIHTSSFDAHRQLPGIFGEDDSVLDGFLAQVSAVSVGVRAIIDRAVDENASLVLDGVALVPGLIDLAQYEGRAHVFFQVVARFDPGSMQSQFRSRAEREKHRDAQRYLDELDAILEIQDYVLEQADREDVPIIENATLEGSVLLVIRHVVEQLRKREKAASTR